MRRLFFVLGVGIVLAGFLAESHAGEFVSAVTSYTEGTFATESGAQYNDTNPADEVAIGQPRPIQGQTISFPGIITPFEGPFENTQLLAFGLGGNMTMQFAQPMSVTGAPQIGIFTSAALVDKDYPNGSAGTVATTDAMDEFGAERSAMVEVASHTGVFQSLGRVVFANPMNFYVNATDPYQYPAPDPAVPASFDKPFTGTPADFDGDSFSQVIAELNGSAGGNWISVPTNLGLSDVEYVRLSDPEWEMPDGTLVDNLASRYYPTPPADGSFVKPADLFVDGAVLIPEPGSIAIVFVALGGLRLRRR